MAKRARSESEPPEQTTASIESQCEAAKAAYLEANAKFEEGVKAGRAAVAALKREWERCKAVRCSQAQTSGT